MNDSFFSFNDFVMKISWEKFRLNFPHYVTLQYRLFSPHPSSSFLLGARDETAGKIRGKKTRKSAQMNKHGRQRRRREFIWVI
jgi:hypothetical protein